MDLRYETALNNAVNAWAQNRVTDPITMRNLKRDPQQERRESKPFTTTNKTTSTVPPQPALARYGNLGTRLNLYA